MKYVQETMSNEHAMRFLLAGSAMLLAQFLLFKFLAKDLVSAVLTCYFFVLGIVAFSYVAVSFSKMRSGQWFSMEFICAGTSYVAKIDMTCRVTLLPAINRFLPKHWNDDLIVWHVPYFRGMLYFISFLFLNSWISLSNYFVLTVSHALIILISFVPDFCNFSIFILLSMCSWHVWCNNSMLLIMIYSILLVVALFVHFSSAGTA